MPMTQQIKKPWILSMLAVLLSLSLLRAAATAPSRAGVLPGPTVWKEADVSSSNKYLIPNSVDKRPSSYFYSDGCEFRESQAPEVATKLRTILLNSAAGVARDPWKINADGDGSAVAAILGANVTAMGRAIPKVFGEYRIALGGKFDKYAAIVGDDVVRCYSAPAASSRRLACLQKLERDMSVGSIFFTQQLPNFPLAKSHSMAMVLAALYPAVAFDLVTEMRAQNLDASGEIARTRIKLRALEQALTGKNMALSKTIMSVLPMPFTNRATAEQVWDPLYMKTYVLDQYRGPAKPVDPANTALRSLHRPAFDKNRPFPNDAQFAPKEKRDTWIKKAFKKLLRRPKWQGTDTAVLTVRFTPEAQCRVKASHWCGYLDAEGQACRADSAGSLPATCRAESYMCSADTKRGSDKWGEKSAEHAARRVMQSRVEKYYARAAHYVLDEIFEPAKQVVRILRAAHKSIAATPSPRAAAPLPPTHPSRQPKQ